MNNDDALAVYHNTHRTTAYAPAALLSVGGIVVVMTIAVLALLVFSSSLRGRVAHWQMFIAPGALGLLICLGVLADPSRLSILDSLRSGPRIVSEIVEVTGLSQSNVSNHLSCLWDCGLVIREQQGRFVRYRLSDERVAHLLSLTDQLLAEVARGVDASTRYTTPQLMEQHQ